MAEPQLVIAGRELRLKSGRKVQGTVPVEAFVEALAGAAPGSGDQLLPPGVRMHDTMRVKAYPTREYGGYVWAYLGPPAEELPGGVLPEIPQLEFGQIPSENRYVTKQLLDCNWAQIIEGDLDTSHFSFLHMPAPGHDGVANRDVNSPNRHLEWMRRDGRPKFDLLDHEVGFVAGGAREPTPGKAGRSGPNRPVDTVPERALEQG